MAILLTTSYQQIATIPLTYGEIRFYGRYYEQSKEDNYTNFQLKMTYYISTRSSVSFGSADAWMNGSHKQYGYTTFYKGETLIMEETRRANHNTDGSSPTLNVGVVWNATFGGSGENSADIYFPKIDRYPMLTSAPNFNDEENPTITYTTTMGFSNATLSACISITGATDDVPYRTINVSDGSYTFNLTNAERTTLRQACTGKTLQVIFFIRTTANNTNYYSTLTRTMSIINGEPTFTTTITEMNQDVINILNDSSATTLIKNVSKALVRVTPTAYKEATISGVTINNTTITSSPYQTIIVPTSGNFTINVVDSRGYPTAGVETRNLIDYEKVKINNFSFERENPTSSNVILNLDCVYYSLSDDNLNNPVTVQYKLDNGNFATIPSSNYVIDNTNHKLTIIDYEISNILPYTTQGEFTIKISDSLSEISDKITVIKGIPTMDLGEHDLQVNGDIYIADINRENAINVLDYLIPKYIMAKETTRWSQSFTAWAFTPLKLATADTNDSSMFVLDSTNRRITVGSGVSKVEISGQIGWFSASSDGEFDAGISKNGRIIDETITRNFAGTNTHNSAITTTVVSVQEGDYFQIGISGAISSATILLVRLFIKKIG